MRRFHPFLLATAATLALPLSAAGPALAQVSVDPNALDAIGAPALPPPPPAAKDHPAHHGRPTRAKPARRGATHGHGASVKAAPPAAQTPATSATPQPAAPQPSATGPTEQQKGLGPSFQVVPTLPGAVPALPAKPSATPPAAPPSSTAIKPADTGSNLPLPATAPPAPPATTTPPATSPAPAAPAPVAPAAAPAPPPASAASPSAGTLPPGADTLTLPYSGEDTALGGPETAILQTFAHRSGPQFHYNVLAFASVPKGDDDPSTPRRIALDRARAVQAALTAAGIPASHIRLLARGNAGGSPPDRVEVVAMPPQTDHSPGQTPPSPAP
ncbi:hypothetical protein [Acidisoma sp. 7E03]